MGRILTAAGQIACPHGGTAPVSCLVGTPLRQIDSQNVLCESHVGAVPFPCPSKPPCTAVTKWVAKQVKARVNGQLLLTDESIPVTNNGPGRVVNAGQTEAQVG